MRDRRTLELELEKLMQPLELEAITISGLAKQDKNLSYAFAEV